MTKEKTINTLCAGCFPMSRCGVAAHLKNGKVTKIEGMTEHPLNKGRLCPKGLASTQILYNPNRLRYPLKRVGKRGEGRWEQIKWSQALDTIANRLKRIKEKDGAEAVAFHRGRRGWWFLPFAVWNRLGKLFGTPNLGSVDYVCHWPRQVGSELTYGEMLTPDYRNTKCIIIWAAAWGLLNTNNGFLAINIFDAMKRGAKLIVIDPRLNFLTSKADIWVKVRPGTDGALALGLLNVIIDEGLYDKDFVKEWTVGFDELRELVKDYTPERVAEITNVPAETIKKVARIYAKAKHACILFGNGLDHHTNSMQAIRAICILRAVTGNIDVPGGDLLPNPGVPTRINEWVEKRLLHSTTIEKRVGVDKWPIYKETVAAYPPSVIDAIITGKPYPIKALIVLGSNPAVQMAQKSMIEEALKKVEFLVVADIFMSPTAKLADIVLPVCTGYETHGFDTYRIGEKGYVMMRRPLIEPLGESRADYEIAFKLGKRLGFKKEFWNGDVKKCLNYHLAPSGITFEDLEKNQKGIYTKLPSKEYRKYETKDPKTGEPKGFDTPSKKVEIYSKRILESYGQDPLPVYREPMESPVSKPDLVKDYPLILTSGARTPVYDHSNHRNIPWLREIIPFPYVEINPQTAKELGIEDGELVAVESLRGSIRIKAKYMLGINPKVVQIPHGWAGPGNVNILTSHEQRDPISGSSAYKSLLCRVRKLR